jgi:hypothetical protein
LSDSDCSTSNSGCDDEDAERQAELDRIYRCQLQLCVKFTAFKLANCPGYKLQFEKDTQTTEFKEKIEEYRHKIAFFIFDDTELSMYVHFINFQCDSSAGNCFCHPCGCDHHTKTPIQEMMKEVDPTMEHMTSLREICDRLACEREAHE